MKKEKIDELKNYIVEGFDFLKYQEKLDMVLNRYCNINERVAGVARFLAKDFPKLPYFWGGGHEAKSLKYFLGIDPEWGSMEKIIYEGNSDYKVGEYYPKSLDCSGFVTWCFVNAGFDFTKWLSKNQCCLNSIDCIKLGKNIELKIIN